MEFGSRLKIKKIKKKLFEKIESYGPEDREKKERCKQAFKKAVGFEMLVFVIALFCPVAPDEAREDLAELEMSFEKIGLEREIKEAITGKRVKVSEEEEAERAKAHQILFDFLISLLTRQNSTLRDITNFTFKAFCSEMNEGSLENILSILNTPNAEANKILITEEEEQPLMEMDEEEDEEEAEAEEESEVSMDEDKNEEEGEEEDDD
jgi:hypothetical protein